MNRLRYLPRLGRTAAGVGALTALLGGPPWALVRFTGWPLPRHLPSWAQLRAFLTTPLSDEAIIKALACVVWALWAITVIAVLIEAAAAARSQSAPRLPVIGPFQAAAAALIGATIAASLHVPQASPRPARPLHAALTASITAAGPLLPAPAARAAAATLSSQPAAGNTRRGLPVPPRPRVYRVVAGDDLWDIAARFLGNGEDWHAIFRLNAGKPQPDGRVLTDPSLIYPGWVLLLPPPGSHGSPAPARLPAAAHPPHHAHHRAAAPHRPGSSRPALHRPETPRTGPVHGSHQPARAHRAAVRLPSGALIGIAVAFMVATAITLAGVQRRRRYRPQPDLAAGLTPGSPPLPEVITVLRRAARPADPEEQEHEAGPHPATPPATDPYLDLYDTSPEPGDPGPSDPGSHPGPGSAAAQPSTGAQTPARPAPPATQAPGTIPLGMRGGSEVRAGIAALGGLGLTGPGALPAARAILAGLLAQSPPAQSGMPARIIIPAADAARLLPGAAAAAVPGLSVPASLEAGLGEMETAIVRQARTTGTSSTGGDPQDTSAAGDHGPGVTLIATCGPAIPRLRGILKSGAGVGVAAVVLGPWPPGTTCEVAADGVVTAVTPPGPALDGVHLFTLSAGEAAAITSVLRDAHGDRPAEPNLTASDRDSHTATRTAATPPSPSPAPRNNSATARPAAAPPGPPPRPSAQPVPAAPGPAREPSAGQGEPPGPGARPVQVSLLGPLRITAGGRELGGGMRKARELLAYLAVHPDGASAEAISEALWPESDPGHGSAQRNLALRKARDMLRTATGMAAPMWITHTSGRYRLDPTLITTDLREFHEALSQARHASSDEERLAACRTAVALYRGELAEGAGYEWAEPHAETARRRALDAWTRIAEILQPHDAEQALAALESALGHDPYNEYLYQRIMRLQAAAGRPEAVRRTLRLLEARLTELGITPGSQTRQVAASLLGTPSPPPPQQRPPAAAPGPQARKRHDAR